MLYKCVMKNIINASIILDRLLEALKLTKDVQLADYLGVSAQAVYQARKKDKVPDGWLVRAATMSNISIDALLRGEAQPAFAAKKNESKVDFPQEANNAFDEEFCTVPLVAAKLSAGGGSLETEGEVLQRMAFRRSWLTRKGNPDAMLMMRVYGDSMEPYMQHGDLTLIDTSRKNIIPHAVFAVGVDDGIYVKALETLPGQKLILRSFNERYSPIEIDMRGDLADSVRIIGKVLWWCHEA